jgi:glyoxylase-like metal-dependent hydrolase (beta-lactamase superfamily II)
MAEVKILVQGYTTADSATEGDEKTCATITLVRDKNIVMVCDPGVLDSQQILIDALKKEGLTINDVNYIFITHSHIDHYRNIGMFPDAKTLEYWGIWDGGRAEDWKENFTEDIKIIKTPGHNYDGLTLLIKTKEGLSFRSSQAKEEIIAVCGDVFWKENYPENDPYASDLKKLQESRQKVLQLADFIIPGHAGMYKVK